MKRILENERVQVLGEEASLSILNTFLVLVFNICSYLPHNFNISPIVTSFMCVIHVYH